MENEVSAKGLFLHIISEMRALYGCVHCINMHYLYPRMLWKYLKHVAENLHNLRRLLEAVHKDNRGPYRRALVATVRRRTYSMGYKIVKIKTPIKNLPFFTREDGELIPGVLEYFTEGIVPFLNSFFNIALDPKLLNEIPNGEEITVQIASALIVST